MIMDKVYNVELTGYNIEQIIGSLKCTIAELSKHSDKELNRIRIGELKTLLNYLETI